MTQERWQQVVAMVRARWHSTDEGTESLADRPGTRRFIVFVGPQHATMRLEWHETPAVLGKTTLGARRAGATAHVSYTYSDTDTVHRLLVSSYDDTTGLWKEMPTDALTFFSKQ